MEMTPISHRDVSVSSGVGADTHGRETSSSDTREEINTKAATATTAEPKKTADDFEKPEVPMDPRADALAARLRMADPQMDSKTAKALAKSLLTPPHAWETKSPSTSSTGDSTSHIDVSA